MSHTGDDDRFAEGFLDDFFAEADEHLSAIRRNLLALETALPDRMPPPAALEELFRSFHSLKGISGMVELREAEVLAHDMESCLRALREHQVVLSAHGVGALIDGARALEEVIAARRQHSPMPDIDPTRRQLADLVSRSEPSSRSSATPAAPAAGGPTPSASVPRNAWLVRFAPSNELIDRGINVNVVREKLRGIGEILEARPIVPDSGGIAFEFVLATDAGADVFERWRDAGIQAERIEASGTQGLLTRPERAESVAVRGSRASAESRMVRVDLARLDAVMDIIADIVVSRQRLDDALEGVERKLPQNEWRALEEVNHLLERQVKSLRTGVLRVRLVPVRDIFSRMPFVVRDLARDDQKQVKLEVAGQDTEIDKFVIERMMDPILHLVRNAVSHGIEPPGDRIAHGKSPVGTITLRATTIGESVVVEVEDDGRGIDPAAVRRQATAIGLQVPDEADSSTLLELLCTPGLSTRDEADRASGRGVGMAVVKQVVEQLSGTIEMRSVPGRGTRFLVTLPVTLAIVHALTCTIGRERFAVPQSAVREVLEVPIDSLQVFEHNEVFAYRERALPLVRVGRLLGLEAAPLTGRMHVFVVGTGGQAVGLGVDRVEGHREVVVRAFTDPLIHVEGLVGATDLGDGRPVLILDPAALVRMAKRSGPVLRR